MTDILTQADDIDAMLDGVGEPWDPEPGERVSGTVVEIDECQSSFGPDAYPVVTIKTEDGDFVSIYCSRSVLLGQMQRARPQIGDRIGVRFDGKKMSKSGNSYFAYRVVNATKRKSSYQWDQAGTDDDVEEAADPYSPEDVEDSVPF